MGLGVGGGVGGGVGRGVGGDGGKIVGPQDAPYGSLKRSAPITFHFVLNLFVGLSISIFSLIIFFLFTLFLWSPTQTFASVPCIFHHTTMVVGRFRQSYAEKFVKN